MMALQREKIADNVYCFQSDSYALVTAGVVVGSQWAVVIDTLPIPDETLAMREFVEQELGVPVRYIINTHYHADHSWGNCLFPGATVIAHRQCRLALEKLGQPSLEEARKHNPIFRQVKIILPQIVFEKGYLTLRVGKKNLVLLPLPGHSRDGIGVLVEDDRVLFAGDAFMSLPYIVDGNLDDSIASLNTISQLGLENIIQGHGDIILRGEIEGAVQSNLHYLKEIDKAVRKAGRRKFPGDYLNTVGIEACGKSRVLIGGMAEELHRRNLRALYRQEFGVLPPESSQAH